MKVLSLFDGISCGQIAIERAGFKPSVYFASEIDRHTIACTQLNYPQTVQLGDVIHVRKLAESGFFGRGDIDLLIGGSPCQGFSSAGAGLNFSDPRSALFFEYIRIKNAIRPKWFMLENVKMKQEWSNIISMYMGVFPTFIDSSDFSAASRKRLYWTNIPIRPWVSHGPRLSDILNPGWFADREKSYAIDANYFRGTNLRRYFFRGSRQIVFKNGLIIPPMTINNANFIQRLIADQWRKLTVEECERLMTLPSNYTSGMTKNGAYKAIGNGWTIDVVAHIFKGLQ